MNTYDKPFKTYKELIQIMKDRNIIIRNDSFAETILSEYSYYSLVNGYKNTFLSIPGSDNFIQGTTIEELYTLYMIDTTINSILFKYILFIEKSLKSKMSYIIAEEYGVYTDLNRTTPNLTDANDYLYKGHYSNSNGHRVDVLRTIRGCIHSGNNNIISHYHQTKNHLPPWILTTNVMFGQTIKWYSILKDAQKLKVCNSFITTPGLSNDEKKEFFLIALNLLKEYRNKIAHGSRTFNVSQPHRLPKKQALLLSNSTLSESEYLSSIGQSDLYAITIVLSSFMKDEVCFRQFQHDIAILFNGYAKNNIIFGGKTLFDIYNLPSDYLNRLKLIY